MDLKHCADDVFCAVRQFRMLASRKNLELHVFFKASQNIFLLLFNELHITSDVFMVI